MMRYDVLLRNQVLPYLGKTKVAMLQKKDIEGWVTKLASDDHGLPSITKATALLAQILDFAIDRNILTARNPVKGVELPSPPKTRKVALTPVQLKALASECEPYGGLIMFLGLTGTRISEALVLKVADIDLTERSVTIDKAFTFGEDYKLTEGPTKTNQVRKIPLPLILVEQLEQHVDGRAEEEYLFKGAGGGSLNYGWFRKRYFGPAVKKLGLSNVTIHSLRHSFASILIQNRAAISNVSAMLGHSSTQLTLKTYTHTYADGLRGDISKMDEIFGFQAGQERGREPARAV